MQKDMCMILIQIRNIIDFISDGYHEEEIKNLLKINDEIFEKLTPEVQKKFLLWLDKRYATK